MNLTRLALGAILTGTTLVSCLAPAAARDFTLKLAHHYPDVHIQAAGLKLFAEEVEAKSEGRIKVEVYPAETLVSGREALDAVENNVVQAAPMPGNYQTGIIPSLQYFTYPFMFDDASHFRRAVEGGIKDLLVPEYAKHNIVLLNYYHKGALHLMDKGKFLTSEDAFSGERVRSLGPAISELLSALGANPLSVPLGEVDSAIERNVIDAVTTNCAAHTSRGWVEHLKFVTFADMSQGGEGLGINAGFYNGLPADLQEIVQQAAKDMEDLEWTSMIADDEEACFDKWEKAGAQVHKLTAEEKALFVSRSRPILDKAIADNPDIQPFADIADQTR